MDKKKKNIINLPVKSKPKETGVLKEGIIGDLQYKVFDRGNIQLTDGVHTFRKDCKMLDELLGRTNYKDIKEGGSFEIPGAGDTDPLILTKEKDDIVLSLGNGIPPTILKLKNILGAT